MSIINALRVEICVSEMFKMQQLGNNLCKEVINHHEPGNSNTTA